MLIQPAHICLFTNDAIFSQLTFAYSLMMLYSLMIARELDNRLLWASTENRKQIEVCELAELTSFLLISFTSTAVRLTVVTLNNTTHMAVHS